VHRLHEVAKFVHRAERALVRAVGRMRGEKGDRGVAPVVRQPRRRVLRVVGEDREQLHRRDPEILQIGDLLDQSRVGAAPRHVHPRTRMPRHAPDVRLVDHRARSRAAGRLVVLPIVGRGVDDDAFHRRTRRLAIDRGRDPVVAMWNHDAFPVGIEEGLRGIEAHPPRRIVGTAHPPGVELPRLHAGDEGVPIVVGALRRRIERDNPARTEIPGIVEEEEFHLRRRFREDREIRASVFEVRSQRMGQAGGVMSSHGRGPIIPERSVISLCVNSYSYSLLLTLTSYSKSEVSQRSDGVRVRSKEYEQEITPQFRQT